MKIYIDQSGKIEETAKPTVLAFSNNTQGSLIILAKDKKEIQKIYRQLKKPKMFTIQTFSALVYLLLEKHKIRRKMITLDEEYKGQNSIIKSYIIQLAGKQNKIKTESGDVHFTRIGKRSNAHKLAIECFRRRKADFTIKSKEVIALTMLYEK